jgi:hypothetical protein
MVRPAHQRTASAGISGANTLQPEANQLPLVTKKVTPEHFLKNIYTFKKYKNLSSFLQKVVSQAKGETTSSIHHLFTKILWNK